MPEFPDRALPKDCEWGCVIVIGTDGARANIGKNSTPFSGGKWRDPPSGCPDLGLGPRYLDRLPSPEEWSPEDHAALHSDGDGL